MTLDIIMVGVPKAQELSAFRRTARAFGVPVANIGEPDWLNIKPTGPLYALETWRGPNAHDLSEFEFPEDTSIVMGTTNQGLDLRWQNVITGSLYIPSRGLLTAPVAAAIVMYEWSKQRGGAR